VSTLIFLASKVCRSFVTAIIDYNKNVDIKFSAHDASHQAFRGYSLLFSFLVLYLHYGVFKCNVPTMYQCAEICQASDECQSITFDKLNKQCKLNSITWPVSGLNTDAQLSSTLLLNRSQVAFFVIKPGFPLPRAFV
jgi:hypothetical protein